MEKVNELAGIGNHNTAEFWEYDMRLGRRWNVDPIVKPSESSYAGLNNSPIWKLDIKGDDARIEKVANKNGKGGTISISTTVHVKGKEPKEVEEFVKNANDFNTKMQGWGKTSGTYVDEDGGEWKITLNIKYIKDGESTFEEGDNRMDLSNIDKTNSKGEYLRSKVMGGDKWDKANGWDYNTTGNTAGIYGGKAAIKNGFGAFHETMHFLGLSDRYEESGYVPLSIKLM